MNPLLVTFEVLCFHVHLYLVQQRLHLFGLMVSFLVKEFCNLTLMVALAEPPFGALLMAPKPSITWFINLVTSWFCLVASLCWTTNTLKVSIITKNSLDDFSTFGTSFSYFLGDSSTSRHSRTCLLLFPLLDPFKRRIKEFTSPFDLEEWKLTCSFDSTIGLRTFSFPFYFLKATRVFTSEPMFTSFSPFFCLIGKESFHGPLPCSDPPHPSMSSSSWVFVKQVLLPPPHILLNFGPLFQKDPPPPQSKVLSSTLPWWRPFPSPFWSCTFSLALSSLGHTTSYMLSSG